MKKQSKPLSFVLLPAVIFSSFLFFLILLSNGSMSHAQDAFAGTPSYLPVLLKIGTPTPIPTPTPTAIPPEPQFVKNIPLPQAQCSNYVNVNNTSGYAYVLNNFSHDVAIFKDANYVTTVPSGGEWPTKATSDPDSNRTFITNLHKFSDGSQTATQLGMFQNAALAATYDQFFEGYQPLYNTTNDYLYVTDLGQTIRVFDASGPDLQFLADISMAEGIKGWITSITHDPLTGRVFAASWSNGEIYVIEGTTLVTTLSSDTWGPADLAIDPVNRYLYVVGQEVANRPPGYPVNNVVVRSIDPPFTEVALYAITKRSTSVAYDNIGGYVYVINPDADSISIFKDGAHLKTLPVGSFPSVVEVNPQTGYAFVTNTRSHDITVLKNGQVVKTIASQGIRPIALDFDLQNNYVYVANRGTEEEQFECNSASVTILR